MDRGDLIKKLAQIRPCTSSQGFVPILSHFCFEKDRITASNGAQAITVPFKSEIHCGVPGELFYKLLNSFAGDEVTVAQKEDTIVVKAGKSTSRLGVLPSSDFVIPEWTKDDCVHVEIGKDFIKGLSACFLSVETNPLEQSRFGITFKSTKAETLMYSTDEKRLSRYKLEGSLTPGTEEEVSVLLPKVFCELVIAVGKEVSSGTLYIGADHVVLKCGETQVYSKLPADVPLIDFEPVISEHYSGGKLSKVPEGLRNAIDRNLILTSSDSDHVLSLEIDGTSLELFSQSGVGTLRDEVTLETDHEVLEFKMDAVCLQQGLEAVDEMVFIRSRVDDSAVLFIGQKNNFFHMFNSLRPETTTEEEE